MVSAAAASSSSPAKPQRRRMQVLHTCSEVHARRSCSGALQEGFSVSTPLLGATLQEQQEQQQQQVAVGPRRRVGFVPTLGGLHEGHLSLIRHARRACDEVWVSIFLNPTQFQQSKDFSEYPMDLQQDIELLRQQGNTDVLFVPSIQEMYSHITDSRMPLGDDAQALNPFAELLVGFHHIEAVPGEGNRRPGFFSGVGRVVLKLFSLVRPTDAFFGQKDFLQTVCIRSLARCSCMYTRVVLCPTAREPQGLPLASRNKRLDAQQYQKATEASRVLKRVEALYDKGEREVAALEAAATAAAAEVGAVIEYLTFCRQADGLLLGALGGPRGPPGGAPLCLPSNEEICVAIAIKASPVCSIVDNFVLSDTHKYGDLMPRSPNTPEASPGPSVSLLPLHAAPCVLLLRSRALRLLRVPEEGALQLLRSLEEADPEAADAQQQGPPAATDYFSLVDAFKQGAPQPIGYLAVSRQQQQLQLLRVFVHPRYRRQKIAQSFVETCLLLLHMQLQQQQVVRCIVPGLAVKVVEALGFSQVIGGPSSATEGAPKGPPLVEMSVDLAQVVQRILAP